MIPNASLSLIISLFDLFTEVSMETYLKSVLLFWPKIITCGMLSKIILKLSAEMFTDGKEKFQ